VTQLAVASTADAVPNDTIAQAAPLEVGKPVQGTNVGALTEAGDATIVCPSPDDRALGQVEGRFAHRHTVWWRFRRNRPYTFVSTFGSSFDTTLVVYRRVPGGPLEVVGCAYNYHLGEPSFSTVYLPPQRGPDRAAPDPPDTEYFAQVGGCIVPTKFVACGPRVGTIRLGAYEGLPTKLGYRYFITCKHVRLTSLRLTKLPPNARIVAIVDRECTTKGCKKRSTTKSRRVRGRSYDARRLIGVVRLRRNLDNLRLIVESRGRVTKVFNFFPGERGEAPLAGADCLPPGEELGFVGYDCGDPLTRFRDPPRLKCGRGSGAHSRARRFRTQAVARNTTIVNPTRIR
jgi:hypothetical protein